MSPTNGTNIEKFAYAEVLGVLRERARKRPGSWVAAQGDGGLLTVEWAVAAPDASTPESLRLSRTLVEPVAEDLERAQAALPKDLEMGPIHYQRSPGEGGGTIQIGLRPATGRPAAERCPICRASPRYGTPLFGDLQRCAVCTLRGASRTGREGSAVIMAVFVAMILALLVGGTFLHLSAAQHGRGARTRTQTLDAAATGAIEVMTERLLARAQTRLGWVTPADLAALDAAAAAIPVTAPATLAEAGYRVVAVRDLDPLPEDADPLAVWTDQPRLTYDQTPRAAGQTAARTVEVEIRARVTGPAGTQRTFTRTVAISRLQAHPYAMYTAGGMAEFCARALPGTTIAGSVRVDGTAAFYDCPGTQSIVGTLEARDQVANYNTATNRILSQSGWISIPSYTREAAEGAGTAILASTEGRVRLPAAWGGTYEPSRFQDASLAGTGECADRAGACGGRGYFAPSAAIQHVGGGALQITCGPAFGFTSLCQDSVAPAVRYRAWTAASAPGTAGPDPAQPTRLWRGLIFDPRRESWCTATVAGNTYSTHRCPSNAYGWVLDMAALRPLRGGILYVAAAAVDPPGRAAAGAQEVLVIRNAATLSAPLTIVSDLPVYVVGSFNTTRHTGWRGPPPAMIDAPRITALPAEADEQLGLAAGAAGWASVWDLVPPAGSAAPSALPLAAAQSVTYFAVLRTQACVRPEGVYVGGAIDHAPAPLGDWSRAEIRLVGAAEVSLVAGATAAACQLAGTAFGVAADGSAWQPPLARSVLYDPRLASPTFRVPGSYLAENLPVGGVVGASNRTPARQANATGGYGVARITRQTARRTPRPAIAAFPALPTLPPAPSAL